MGIVGTADGVMRASGPAQTAWIAGVLAVAGPCPA